MAGRSRVAGCLLLAVHLGLLAGCAQERGAAAPASRSESTTAPVSEPSSDPLDPPSATDVVDEPAAKLVDVAVSPNDPQVRAAVWWTCPTKACSARHVAVTVSTDGFRTRVVADRVWRNVPTVTVDGSGNTVVTSYGRRTELTLARPDGSTVEVRRSQDESPVGAGEIVAGVEHDPRETSFLATDPAGGTAHPVPVPADTAQLEQLPSGQLRAITRRHTYAWSEDGGATWTESASALDGALVQSFVTSAPGEHVLVGGGDGATLFPFGEIRRLDDQDSWSVTDLDRSPTAYIGVTAVLPDGRFLADVDAWSDNRRLGGRLRGTPPGLYVSEGDDWASYTRLELGDPFTEPAYNAPDVRYVEVSGARTTLGAIGSDARSWWTSEDLGASWTEQPVR